MSANNVSIKSDQSDLLLEYKDEENSTSSSQKLQPPISLDLQHEPSATDSVDTLSLFNLLTNNGKQQECESSEGEDKMVKILIKLLVKSCRIFDVATQKTDNRVSYWRYANPIVALVKQRNETNKDKCMCVDSAVQTGEASNVVSVDDGLVEESTLNDTNESEGNLKTIIEAKKAAANGKTTAETPQTQSRTSLMAKSLIELVNESFGDDNDKVYKFFHVIFFCQSIYNLEFNI